MTSRARRAALALVLVALAAAGPARAADGAGLIATFDRIRVENGLPGGLVEVPEWSEACALHNRYRFLTGRIGHFEEPDQPGYTPEGDDAARASVLSPAPSAPGEVPFLEAPYHLAALLMPQLSHTGAAQNDGHVCIRTVRGTHRRSAASDQLLVYPGDGRAGVPPQDEARELPWTPGQEVGSAGDAHGPHLLLFADGPWATSSFGGIGADGLWTFGGRRVEVTGARLEGPGGEVPLIAVDGRHPDRALAGADHRDPDPEDAAGAGGLLPGDRDPGVAAGRAGRHPARDRAHPDLVVRHGRRLAGALGRAPGHLARPRRPPRRVEEAGRAGARGRGPGGRPAGPDGGGEGGPGPPAAGRRPLPAGRPARRPPRGLHRDGRGRGRRRAGADLRRGGGGGPPDDGAAPRRAPAPRGDARPPDGRLHGVLLREAASRVCGPRRCRTAWRTTSRQAVSLRPPIAALAASPGRPGVRWRLAARPAGAGPVAWRAVSLAVR